MAEYTTKLAEDEVLRLENLSIQFGGLKAVDDLSFAIKEKEIFGLIGPNGAGKTTAFNCITQFYKPSSGAVYFRNKDGQVENLVDHPVHSIIRKGLVRTFQNVELVGELSIIDNVLIGGHIDFKASGFEQALRLPRARREEKQMREKAEDVLRFMGIAELKDALVAGQPYGIRKKVEMARTLMCNPKLIILDEPAAGLNDVETQQLADNIYQVREKYGVCTVLGVSNISFGLPYRPAVNSNFYTMAMQSGLSAGIINPLSEDMMRSYYSFCALMNYDENCEKYIEQYGSQKVQAVTPATKAEMTLKTAIEKGLKEEAHHITAELVKDKAPLDIINEELIPALDQVGKGFEKGTVFLPQLLMSADAAKIAFAVLKDELAKSGESEQAKDKVILATVKGDIHDIGKNIVKVLLENYSFDVIDLGKDVPPEEIVETAIKEDVRLVGLSALMTTTVVSMEETIRQLRKKKPECKVMVGGAVLNQDYSDMIGADFYGKDAMQSVYYAQSVFGRES